jgi:hypothetical protein
MHGTEVGKQSRGGGKGQRVFLKKPKSFLTLHTERLHATTTSAYLLPYSTFTGSYFTRIIKKKINDRKKIEMQQ